MGVDKAGLELHGRTLLQHVVDRVSSVASEVVVVGRSEAAPPTVTTTLPLHNVADPVPDEGPLVGIARGLAAATAPVAVVVGCDMPFVRPALLRLVAAKTTARWPVVMPLHDGWPEPLCSGWHHTVRAALDVRVAAGERSVVAASRALGLRELSPEQYARADPDGRSFRNLNTPAELAAATALPGQTP